MSQLMQEAMQNAASVRWLERMQARPGHSHAHALKCCGLASYCRCSPLASGAFSTAHPRTLRRLRTHAVRGRKKGRHVSRSDRRLVGLRDTVAGPIGTRVAWPGRTPERKSRLTTALRAQCDGCILRCSGMSGLVRPANARSRNLPLPGPLECAETWRLVTEWIGARRTG